jgi:hypothetical protein
MSARTLASSLLVFAGVSPVLIAQAPPGVSRAEAATSAFSALGANYVQGQFERFGNPAGTWTGSITNGASLEVGTYNQVTQTWTPNTEAAALNPDTGNFGLMQERTGRYCLFDRADGVYFSYRTGPGANFAAPVKVTGITGTYVDPAPCWSGGKLQAVWTTFTSIVMQELDITTLTAPKVVGTLVTITNRIGASGTIHSPTPVNGPDGDIEGLFLAESLGTDLYFKAGLDPAVPHILMVDTPAWANNGGVTGARFIYSRSGAKDVEAAWMTGDVEAPGGTVDIGCGAPSTKNSAVTIVWIAASTIAPISLPAPLNVGKYALDIGTLIPLGTIVHGDASQYGTMSFKVPNDTKFKGKLAIQGLSFDPATAPAIKWVWTNTAHVVIQ